MISDKKGFKELMERHPLADKFAKEVFKKVDIHLPSHEVDADVTRVTNELLEKYHNELSENKYNELLNDVIKFNEELTTKCDIFELEFFIREYYDLK